MTIEIESQLEDIQTIARDVVLTMKKKREHYNEFGGQELTPNEKRIRNLCVNILLDIREFVNEG